MKEKVEQLLAREGGSLRVVPLDCRIGRGEVASRVKLTLEGETEKAYRLSRTVWRHRRGKVQEVRDTVFLPKSKTAIGKKHVLVPEWLVDENDLPHGRLVVEGSYGNPSELIEREVQGAVYLLENGSAPEWAKIEWKEGVEEVGEDELFDEEEETKPEQPPPQDLLDFVRQNAVVAVPLRWREEGKGVSTLRLKGETEKAFKFEKVRQADGGTYRDVFYLPKSTTVIGKNYVLVSADVVGGKNVPDGDVLVKGSFPTVSGFYEVKASELKKLMDEGESERLIIKFHGIFKNVEPLKAEEVETEKEERKRRNPPRPPSR